MTSSRSVVVVKARRREDRALAVCTNCRKGYGHLAMEASHAPDARNLRRDRV